MPKKPNHKLKLISTASGLFQRQGYNATGVSQIIRDSDTPRGSFYYYFPSGKEELARETVLFTGEEIRVIIEKAFTDADSFSSGVDNITNRIADWFAKTGYSAGCPITSIHLEQTPKNNTLKSACQDVFSSWVQTVENYAQSLGHYEQAQELGEAVILGLEGAWILARSTQSTNPFLVAGKMVKSMLGKNQRPSPM